MSASVCGRAAFSGGNGSSEESVCGIDPVVETPSETVDTSLIVVIGEAGKERFNLICFPIMVEVSGQKDIRSRTNQKPFAGRHQPGGEWYLIGEDGGLIILSVSVRIFECLYPASGFIASV